MGGGKGGGGGTVQSTQTNAPWSVQQPYLGDIFSNAQNLYRNNTPAFFPGSTVSGMTPQQQDALGGTAAQAGADLGGGTSAYGQAMENSILGGQYGGYQNNPGLNTLAAYQATGLPGFQTLQNQAVNGVNTTTGGTLTNLMNNNIGTNNSGASALQGFFGHNAATGAPGTGTLGMYASGGQAGTDSPYTQALTDSVTSHVLPGIQSQFINGGMLSSPEAARSSSEGVTNALGPLLFQRQQQEEQNQLGASNSLLNAFLSGNQQQIGAATGYNQGALSGAGLQSQAAGTLGSQQLQGSALQQSAANLAGNQQLNFANAESNMYNQGVGQMLSALGLAPQVQQLPYNDLSQLYNSGSTQQQQSQQQLNDQIARFNFGQQLPYQQLAQYIGEVTGNYGGVSNLTQPNTQSPFANILGGAMGLNSALGSNGLFGSSGMFGSGGALGGMFGGSAADAAASAGLDFGGGGAAMGIADSVPNVLPLAAATVICTELHRQGRMPTRHYVSSARADAKIPQIVRNGYHLWAVPSVRHMRRKPNSLYSRFLAKVFNWRAEDIAARKGVKGARKLWHGRAVTATLAVPCLALGVFAKNQGWQALYRNDAVEAK